MSISRNDSFFISDVFVEFQRFRSRLIVAELKRPEIQHRLPIAGVAGAVVRILRFIGNSELRKTSEEVILEQIEPFRNNPKFMELCSRDCRELDQCSFEEECQIKHIRRITEFLTDIGAIDTTPELVGLLAAKSYRSCVKRNELSRIRSKVFQQYRRIRDHYADAFFKRPIPLPIGSRKGPRKIVTKVIRKLLDQFGRAYFNSNAFKSLIGTATDLLNLPIVSEVLSKRFPKIDLFESNIEELEISLIKSLTISPILTIITDNAKPSDRVARIGVVAFVFLNPEFERICGPSKGQHH